MVLSRSRSFVVKKMGIPKKLKDHLGFLNKWCVRSVLPPPLPLNRGLPAVSQSVSCVVLVSQSEPKWIG